MPVIVYHLLRRDTSYDDLGAHYFFDERDRQAVQRRLVRRLQQLGLKVTLEPITPAAWPAFSEQPAMRRRGTTAR